LFWNDKRDMLAEEPLRREVCSGLQHQIIRELVGKQNCNVAALERELQVGGKRVLVDWLPLQELWLLTGRPAPHALHRQPLRSLLLSHLARGR